MKIKHFQGYGCVEATKVKQEKYVDAYGREMTKVVVLVKGNHECGLTTNGFYTLYKWLVKRFYKRCNSYLDIFNMSYNNYYEKIDGIDVEHCQYTFYLTDNW